MKFQVRFPDCRDFRCDLQKTGLKALAFFVASFIPGKTVFMVCKEQLNRRKFVVDQRLPSNGIGICACLDHGADREEPVLVEIGDNFGLNEVISRFDALIEQTNETDSVLNPIAHYEYLRLPKVLVKACGINEIRAVASNWVKAKPVFLDHGQLCLINRMHAFLHIR